MAKIFQAIKKLVNKNKFESLICLLIIIVAAFLRFYRLPEYMTFLGDEGRDAIIVKKILTQLSFPLLGPPTSIGNMYNGPLYYYMMAVPMVIFGLNPAAAAGMVALIGTLTVGLIYYLNRIWFGLIPAVIGASLYAVSPITITYSRSSWNPNPAPFFALLIILGLFNAHKSRNYLWLTLVGGALAFAIQMHLLSLILLPLVALVWLSELYRKTFRIKTYNFWKGLILGLMLFFLLMSPLLIFDLRHNFMNYHAFHDFFFSNQSSALSFNLINFGKSLITIYQYSLIERYLAGSFNFLSIFLSILIPIPLIFAIYLLFRKHELNWPLVATGLWLLLGLIGLALLKINIYDHYLTFFNPSPYILLGGLIYVIGYIKNHRYKTLSLLIASGLACLLIISNLINNPLKLPPNNQLLRTQQIARFIIKLTQGQPYNFALLASRNYDSAYQYYLDIYGDKPAVLPFNITEQLFVVCEDNPCQPVNNPKYEIAAFGWVKVERSYNFDGLNIYKLVHNRSATNQGV